MYTIFRERSSARKKAPNSLNILEPWNYTLQSEMNNSAKPWEQEKESVMPECNKGQLISQGPAAECDDIARGQTVRQAGQACSNSQEQSRTQSPELQPSLWYQGRGWGQDIILLVRVGSAGPKAGPGSSVENFERDPTASLGQRMAGQGWVEIESWSMGKKLSEFPWEAGTANNAIFSPLGMSLLFTVK